MALHPATNPRHVIAICGGAVAGSEAAALAAKQGALVIVIEQNLRPYGKIEDGLPRWHAKLRNKEYAKIDANLSTEGVFFVPGTRLGEHLSFADATKNSGFSAVILAHGAWRDRTLTIDRINEFVGKGLSYQNSFVYWFNHYEEADYSGAQFDIKDRAIVIGGGLASIDVCKIINLELYKRALAERGIEVDIEEMEIKGIPRTLQAHELTPEDFNIHGCTLYYRRAKEDMPLASLDNPTPEQLAKLRVSRTKIINKVSAKYLVRLEANATPVAFTADDGQLSGLVFGRTEVVDGRVKLTDETFEVPTSQVISSIGSIPMPIDGVPMRGELYEWEDWSEGKLVEGVYGLGNVLTGKGNIKASRRNSQEITARVVEEALSRPPVPAETVNHILDMVQKRWDAVEFPGDYTRWIEANRPQQA